MMSFSSFLPLNKAPKAGVGHSLVLLVEGVVGQILVFQHNLLPDGGLPKLAPSLGLGQVQQEQEGEQEQHHPG